MVPWLAFALKSTMCIDTIRIITALLRVTFINVCKITIHFLPVYELTTCTQSNTVNCESNTHQWHSIKYPGTLINCINYKSHDSGTQSSFLLVGLQASCQRAYWHHAVGLPALYQWANWYFHSGPTGLVLLGYWTHASGTTGFVSVDLQASC